MSEQRTSYDAHAQAHAALVAETISRNTDSIHAVPRVVLPDGEVRHWLLTLATDGQDVCCYQSAGHGIWNIWLLNERVPLTEFVAGYLAAVTSDGAAATDSEVA